MQIQIIGYNSDLYDSYEEASVKPNGIVGIAIFLKVSPINAFSTELYQNHLKQNYESSQGVKILTSQLNHIKFRGN